MFTEDGAKRVVWSCGDSSERDNLTYEECGPNLFREVTGDSDIEESVAWDMLSMAF